MSHDTQFLTQQKSFQSQYYSKVSEGMKNSLKNYREISSRKVLLLLIIIFGKYGHSFTMYSMTLNAQPLNTSMLNLFLMFGQYLSLLANTKSFYRCAQSHTFFELQQLGSLIG